MNLKSVAMATGLVLTFAAGAWLSTIMLAPPQRPIRETAQEPAQVRPPAQVRQPTTLPELPASDSILPPLPPLPQTTAATPPAPVPPTVAPPADPPVAEPPMVAAAEPVQPPAAGQAEQQPDPSPPASEAPPPPPPLPPPVVESLPAIPEAPPALAEASPPVAAPVAETAQEPEPPAPAVPAISLTPPLDKPGDEDIDPGIAALSALVTRAPLVPAPSAPVPAPLNDTALPPPARMADPVPTAAPAVPGPYFTIQVGSFQDPSNAASLQRSLGTKGWEAFVVDWTDGSGQVWKVVRVGRYQTEAQAVNASAELMSAANLRGNVIKVR